MVPTVLLPPTTPSTLQVTESPLLPVVLAVKVTVPPLPTAVGVEGDRTTAVVVPVEEAFTVTAVEPVAVGSATLGGDHRVAAGRGR